MKYEPIELHHIEIEIIGIQDNKIILDCAYFTSERRFIKVMLQNYLKKKVGDIIYIDAKTSKIT